MKRSALLLAAWLAAAGCATVAPSAPPPAPAPAPAPAASQPAPSVQVPGAIHWLRTSAEYEALALQAYRAATERLEERVAAGGAAPGSWGVALDADETVLDNSDYMKERALAGQGFTPESWRAWVERRAAAPVPGAAAFLRRVHELGGKIAIVTNRDAAECPPTEDNFRALGLPFDVMLCRTDTGEKEPRWDMVEAGTTPQGAAPFRLLLWVGDNIADFPGLDQTLRGQPEGAFDAFGRRFFVIPNPMYGSWERNPPR